MKKKKKIEEKSLKSLRRKPNYSLKDNLRIWYYLNLPLSKFILFSVENQDFQLRCVLPASTVYNRYLYTKNEYCIFYKMLPICLKRVLAIVHFKEICVENVWKRNDKGMAEGQKILEGHLGERLSIFALLLSDIGGHVPSMPLRNPPALKYEKVCISNYDFKSRKGTRNG